ncbi:MAG: hypothetical protein ABEJ68_03770 [Halobacteriaceae archaeon]
MSEWWEDIESVEDRSRLWTVSPDERVQTPVGEGTVCDMNEDVTFIEIVGNTATLTVPTVWFEPFQVYERIHAKEGPRVDVGDAVNTPLGGGVVRIVTDDVAVIEVEDDDVPNLTVPVTRFDEFTPDEAIRPIRE